MMVARGSIALGGRQVLFLNDKQGVKAAGMLAAFIVFWFMRLAAFLR